MTYRVFRYYGAHMSNASTKRRLADALLGGRLDDFVAERLAGGKSWRQVSIDLRDQVDVDVHEETLKRWFADSPAITDASGRAKRAS